MALPADYISGTITLTNGSPNFTGTGTGWQAADFREGDILLGVEDHAGQVYVIATITSQTSGTLTQEWAGTSGTYTYRMRYEWDSSRVSAQARAMVELLGNGNLEALAGLTGAPDQVPVFTGPGAMTLVPSSSFAPGAGSITNAQLADVPTATLKGRVAAGAGAPTDLTAAQVWSLLGVAPVANIPATLTPDKAYRRGNILGTVSQSSGVPTGAIIERGSNANGEYIKWADGTQICTHELTQSTPGNTPNGPFWLAALPTWTFPASFISKPQIIGTPVRQAAGGANVVAVSRPSSSDYNQTSVGGLGVWFHASNENAVGYVSITAIGRWF